MSTLKRFGPRFGISIPGTSLHIGVHEDRFRHSTVLKEADCAHHWLFTMIPCGQDMAAGGDDWCFLRWSASRKVLTYKKEKVIYLKASGDKLEAESVDSGQPKSNAFIFRFDVEKHLLQHHGGKYIQPEKGKVKEGSKLKLVSLHQDQIKNAVRVMPCYYQEEAEVNGSWEKINAVVMPLATHAVKYVVKIGRTKEQSERLRRTTDVTVETAVSWFKSSTRYSLMTETASKESFSEEKTEERTVTVSRGQTVVTWQYVCEAKVGPDKHVFRTNIFQDTDSISKVPDDPFKTGNTSGLDKWMKTIKLTKEEEKKASGPKDQPESREMMEPQAPTTISMTSPNEGDGAAATGGTEEAPPPDYAETAPAEEEPPA